MSLRKLSGAAAAGARDSYAPVANQGGSSSGHAGGGASSSTAATSAPSASSGGNGLLGPSKVYASHLAIQSDAIKYRGKYKELKKKVRQIEGENDRLHLKTLRIKRNIQRMRLERAILYERLEAELGMNEDLAGAVHQQQHDLAADADSQDDMPDVRRRPSSKSQVNQSPPSRAIDDGARSGRRNLDYSPSPEEERVGNGSMAMTAAPATHASASKGENPARSSMKITLKRSHHPTNSR